MSSATPTSSPNTVSTTNGTPIAGFALNNTNTNLSTGAVSNSQSSNFVQPGGTTELHVQSHNYRNADIFGRRPSGFAPERLCRGGDGDGEWRYGGAPRSSPRHMSSPISAGNPATSASCCPAIQARCSQSSMSERRRRAHRRHDEFQLCLRKHGRGHEIPCSTERAAPMSIRRILRRRTPSCRPTGSMVLPRRATARPSAASPISSW